MATQPVGSSGYLDTYALLQAANEEEQLYAQAEKAGKENDQTVTSALGNDIMSYLSKIPKGDDGKLSFKDVDEYRKKLETEWDVEVMADLQKLGVDITQQFPLSYDPTAGKVTVSSSHKDKVVIDKYFEDNPDKVKEFNEIIQLGKLTAEADSKLAQSQMVQNLQMQSLAWWYADNTDPANWFDGGGMLAGNGLSSYTGLNLKV